ncbi:MAG: hypothetical protein HYU36_05800 [Planctomycetes bacterium]|nr:hypothetical protein [Planctomycetota bacterium]
MRWSIVPAALSLVASWTSVMAQTSNDAAASAAPAGLGPVYSLDQFGPMSTADEAEKAYQKASADIIAAGGGVLVIPAKAPPGWRPKNNSQAEWRKPPPPATAKQWGPGAGVTVVDARGGTLRVLPPQATGLEISRVLNLPQGQSLPHWGLYPILSLKNTILHGSTSYHDWLQEDVKAGQDQRFYVATIRGIFPGEFLNGLSWGGPVPRLYVKSLGFDREKQRWYFVADTDADVNKGALLSNKNHVNVLDMESFSHNENQTFDVRIWRNNYSQGDNYLIDARFKYMGDVHSTAGDENGVLYAAFVQSLTGIFRGEVEKWDPGTGSLVFKPGPDGSTLGSGRPIINLNPAKWITSGTVLIVRPASYTDDTQKMVNAVFQGQSYPTKIEPDRVGIRSLKMGGLIRFSADAAVTEDAVGRYFAVDEADEYVPNASTVRRWYLIDSVTKNEDGTKDIKIIRHWWGAKAAGSPTLYKPDNYSSDGHMKPLKYVIAPGANAYDVSDAVNNPKRTLKLAPTPFTGAAMDFAANDPVEQAIGPDPFKPVAFRTWLWDSVPGAFPAPVFDVASNGAVMRDSLMWVHGNSTGDVERDKATHYDRNPPWDQYFVFDSTCNTGIRFGADTANAAILFAQPNNRAQPIKWQYGAGENAQPKVASLTVAPDSGDFNFEGGNLRANGFVVAAGLSAGKEPARNLRGKNVAVKAGETTIAVAFPVEEADAEYAVFIEQNWLSNRAVVKKESKGFTVQFERPAPEGARLDWMIVR